MSRRPNIIPSVKLNLALPLPVHAKLTAAVYSELEGRVPLGGYQRLIVDLLQEHFAGKSLDLAPYIENAPPGAFVIRGAPEAILALRYRLEKA